MLGWEFPPYISGGLGTACHGLTRAMSDLGTEIVFVLPTANVTESLSRTTASPQGGQIEFRQIPSAIVSPYASCGRMPSAAQVGRSPGRPLSASGRRGDRLLCLGAGAGGGYGGDLIARITSYAERCVRIARNESFDVIHAHDWVTFPAGLAVAAECGKPLVVHVHSTEFDRSGECVNRPVYEVECAGVHGARAVIAVSHLTKRILVERYGVDPGKVQVIHNGVEPRRAFTPLPRNGRGEKTVLFLGRITMQKGPAFFVNAAARVREKLDDVRFIMAGWGDMGPQVVEQVAAMGLSRFFRFAGFLRGDEVQEAYRQSDVYVMPSVSEPFGLTALEAIQWGVPVILSKNSGVAEVLPHGALKVDFWDVDGMADRIIAILRHPQLAEALARSAAAEIRCLTWDKAARKCVGVYLEHVEALRN